MTQQTQPSISLSDPYPKGENAVQKTGLVLVSLGLLAFVIAAGGLGSDYPVFSFLASILLVGSGSVIYIYQKYKGSPGGVNNTGVWTNPLTSRGSWGWVLGVFLTGFYVVLYWHDRFHALDHIIAMFTPLSLIIRGEPANEWFVYGGLYSLAVLIMGTKAILKYRHSSYQVIRTISVMVVQLFLAFLIPNILVLFKQPEFYFSYFWPLQYEYLFPAKIAELLNHPGQFGRFFIAWSVIMILVGTPILTFFFGKRWYCSWVCGCGGLANTAGDNFRQLSDKSLKAWQIERYFVHGMLLFVIVVTSLLWINSYYQGELMGQYSNMFADWYGFYVGMLFSGVIGVGFYPLMGTRVWCRFGCPMAAILGIQQKFFSRFRITTNGGLCISCGNCSTYCEMGIDVKWYAQRGQNIVRASCVGCGICSTVCPRGVLNLENGPVKNKVNDNPIMIGNEGANLQQNTLSDQ